MLNMYQEFKIAQLYCTSHIVNFPVLYNLQRESTMTSTSFNAKLLGLHLWIILLLYALLRAMFFVKLTTIISFLTFSLDMPKPPQLFPLFILDWCNLLLFMESKQCAIKVKTKCKKILPNVKNTANMHA